ncbi:hypothetical protein [Dethiosulfovibrio salsuginis]|uniref:Uncharacterized protein n=1 Tax=Dethiosulfovibrio salsuginis TaxID=561720 RepID=A0A1X7J8F8_9BACT|nr:hypothetical protein [Dethiosulfovibrio salsuginis]SMG23274.1 hypothetical protein SAMN06275492_10911 [Dethiosulfovibrio salsuginis]
MSRSIGIIVLAVSLHCGAAFGSEITSRLGFPVGKILFDSAFAELEASLDIDLPRDVVIPRIERSMVSRDFSLFSQSEEGLVFSKRGGLFQGTRYLAAFQVVDIREGVRVGVTLSEPVQLIFFDPGILGRKHRSVRFLKPVLKEIAEVE